MLRLIKQTINHKFWERQHSTRLNIYPSNEQKNNIKNRIYGSRGKSNSYKLWDDTRLVVFDTETTGFYPFAGDEIISISGVVVENGEIRYDQIYDQLINPYRPIPNEIVELTGITDEAVKDQPNVYEGIEKFLDFAGDAILVAHNADFDLSFLNIKLKKFCSTKLPNAVFDTCAIARTFFPTLKSHSLDYLIEYFHIPCLYRHTSLGDAIMTAQLFQNLKKNLIKMNINTLEELNYHMHFRSYI